MRLVLMSFCALLAGQGLAGWSPEKWFEHPKSDRAVRYAIKGALDWPNKMFKGELVLTWRNTGTAPAQELPFHLYLNAYSRPSPKAAKKDKKGQDPRGHCKIASVTSGGAELPGWAGADETVYWVRLPRAVNPGDSIEVKVAWESKFPEMQSGSGWAGRYLVASMWHPKIGMYRGDTWECEPFNNDAAFKGDFGNYDLELSLPNALMLANTGTVCLPVGESGELLTDMRGRPVEAAYDQDRKLNFIYKIHAEDVQDFSWIAAPSGSWDLSRLDLGNLQVFFYSMPKNATQLNRMKDAVMVGIRSLEGSFGPYPYPILSIVDLPPEASSAIASPTLAVISSVAFDPLKQLGIPERAAIRQLGDQMFRGALASGGPGDRSLGPQLSAWFAKGAMERAHAGAAGGRRFIVGYGSPPLAWLKLIAPPMLRQFIPESADAPTAALDQLEAALGRPMLENIIRAYLKEKSFKYPNQGDFRQIAERASGRDLGPFWKDFVEGAGEMDYRIRGVTEAGAITLERRGDIVAPVALLVRLKNGQELRREWDGAGSQATFSFEAPIVYAALDPDQEYPCLKSRLHSTWTAKPKRRGLQYWAQQAFGAICGVLQGIGIG